MDKGRKKSDLLAAGRKKLQQYRQKKDNKGGTSEQQGKSSHKARKPGKAADTDGLPPDLLLDGEPPRATESISAANTDESLADSAALPESSGGIQDKDSGDNLSSIPAVDAGAGPSPSVDKEADCSGLDPNNGSSVSEAAQHVETSDATVVQVNDRKDAASECNSGVDGAVFRPEGAEVVDEFSNTVKEEVEAEGNTLNSFCNPEAGYLATKSERDGTGFASVDSERSMDVVIENPSTVVFSKVVDGNHCSTFCETETLEVSKIGNEGEDTVTLGGDSVSIYHETKEDARDDHVGTGHAQTQEGFCLNLPADSSADEETNLAVKQEINAHFGGGHGILYQAQDIAVAENEHEVALESERMEGDINEVHELESSRSVADRVENQCELELSEAGHASALKNVGGQPENRDTSLIKLNELASSTELESPTSMVHFAPVVFVSEELESLKEHLYLTNLTNDFLRLQLDEHIKLKTDFELASFSEISKLNDLVKRTEENSAKMSQELAYCRSELQSMTLNKEEIELQVMSARGEIESLDARAYGLQDELKACQDNSVSLSAELSDCKAMLAALQMENSSLHIQFTSEAEERKKQLAENGKFVHENMKLASELLKQKEQLVVALDKQVQLESDLKESFAPLEKLAEENLSLSICFDMCRFKLQDLDDLHHSLSQSREFDDQKGYNVQNLISGSVTEDLQQVRDNCDAQSSLCRLEGYSTLEETQGQSLRQIVNDDTGDTDTFSILKCHLREADKIMQKLEKTIQGMHFHSMSLSRAGGRAVASGVSKLIQAFESNVHVDDTICNELTPVEGDKSADSLSFAKDQTRDLRGTLEQMCIEVERAVVHYKEEQGRKHAKELKLKYEDEKLKNIHLETKIDEMINNLSDYNSVVDGLQYRLTDISRNADDMSGILLNQIDVLQKEVIESLSVIERERDSARDVISVVIEKLDSATGYLFLGLSDLTSHAYASVDAAQKALEDLNNKLEAVNLEFDSKRNSYEELQCAIRILVSLHGSLSGLVYGSHVNEMEKESKTKDEELLEVIQSKSEALVEQLKTLLDERILLLSVKGELETEMLKRTHDVEELKGSCSTLSKDLEDVNNIKDELERLLMGTKQELEGLNDRCFALVKKLEDLEMIKLSDESAYAGHIFSSRNLEDDHAHILHLEGLISLLLRKCEENAEDIILSKNCLTELSSFLELSTVDLSMPLHILLKQEVIPKLMESSELHERFSSLRFSYIEKDNVIQGLQETLNKTEESLKMYHSGLDAKVIELEQSEQRLASVREKLSIAVAKGKGLVVQRDNLKQSLVDKSSELENCLQELQLKETMLHEAEAKLKSYSDVDRVEALESELSYIRNSATAFRDSFLIKDSIIQRIEEVLDDLDLPEHFHSKDTVEKIELLARSVASNSAFLLTDWDQKSSLGESHSDAGFGVMDTWKEEQPPTSVSELDELKRRFGELQSKFYGLAEQNDMLEQSLMERNHRMQRLEELLDSIDMPSYLRSMESEVRIEWVGKTLSEARHERDTLLLKIENLGDSTESLLASLEESQEKISELAKALSEVQLERDSLLGKIENFKDSNESLLANLDESQKKIDELESAVTTLKTENESLSEHLDKLKHEYSEFSEKDLQNEIEKVCLQKGMAELQEKIAELENGDYFDLSNRIRKLQDLIGDAVSDNENEEYGDGNIECLEEHLRKLLDNYKALCREKSMIKGREKELAADESKILSEEQKLKDMLDDNKRDMMVLKAKLDEVSNSMDFMMEERNTIAEKYHSLEMEMEEMVRQRDLLLSEQTEAVEKYECLLLEVDSVTKQRNTLAEQLSQEEQRSASVREKLNVAVRKGKALVQQRDSLKQTVEEMKTKVEQLQDALNQSATENGFLRTKLAETENSLQNNIHIMNGVLAALHAIDISDITVDDPVQKLEGIGKVFFDCRAAAVSNEHEARKSRRAAQLLLSELNEVQERAENLQEELSKVEAALAECYKQKEEAESARADASSHLEKLMVAHSEERKKELNDTILLKSGIDELRKRCFSVSDLISDVFHKDFNIFCSLRTSAEYILKDMNSNIQADHTNLASSISSYRDVEVEGKSIATILPNDDSSTTEYLSLAGQSLRQCAEKLDAVMEEVQEHSFNVQQEAGNLSMLMGVIQREVGSHYASSESLKSEITHLEMEKKEKESEMMLMHRNLVLLSEACRSSVLEIESRKSENIGKGSESKLHKRYMNEHDLSFTEDYIKRMAETLLSTVKSLGGIEDEIVEGKLKELKSVISDLQLELQEKDIHRNRICGELVSQIRDAESVAKKYSVDLDSVKREMQSLENQLELMANEKNMLEMKVNQLSDMEASSKSLQDQVNRMTELITAKDQEIEGLMQALDEEEAQMESLQARNQELEKTVQENVLALESLEASRTKDMVKLLTTVNKFDELHHLSESLLAEVESLQSQLQDRDSEISFLRQEVTRCTSNVLAEQEINKKRSMEMSQLQQWIEAMFSRFGVLDMNIDIDSSSQLHVYIDLLDNRLSSVIAEFDDLRSNSENKDTQLQIERDKVQELKQKTEILEISLHEKESQIDLFQRIRDSGQPSTTDSLGPIEIEPVRNKGTTPGSMVSLIRSGRKINSEQIAIDMEQDNLIEDEDNDKSHGFKALTMSRVVPKFTRPVSDRIDGLWVSIDRLLMRQPTLRLGLILYWIALHAMLAASI